MFGDINGDGVLEVVFGTASGAVYALSGVSGRDVAPFPFRTHGRIMAPVLLVRLRDNSKALHAVVPSFDGHLYAIDGITGMPLLHSPLPLSILIMPPMYSACKLCRSALLVEEWSAASLHRAQRGTKKGNCPAEDLQKIPRVA